MFNRPLTHGNPDSPGLPGAAQRPGQVHVVPSAPTTRLRAGEHGSDRLRALFVAVPGTSTAIEGTHQLPVLALHARDEGQHLMAEHGAFLMLGARPDHG